MTAESAAEVVEPEGDSSGRSPLRVLRRRRGRQVAQRIQDLPEVLGHKPVEVEPGVDVVHAAPGGKCAT